MSDEYPRPGDTIEITWNDPDWLGKRFVVIECPENQKDSFCDRPSHAWFSDGSVGTSYFMADNYKIVSRAGGLIVSDPDVDKSLDEQRDANLRWAFT